MPQTVFISSRLDELKEERNKVEVGISELWNHEDIPFKVWDWGNAKEIPSGKSTDRIQSEGIGNSDIYVLILGSEYGNKEYGESPTHKEYKDACSKIKEDCILIYIKEVADREEKLDRWIKEIKDKTHTYKPFKNSDELKNLVKIRLRDLWNKRKWGRTAIIKRALHVPEPYYSSSQSSCYGECFDADELSVEIRGDDNSKSFIAFLVSLIFYNTADYDTTIDDISLTAFTKDKETTTILYRIKLDDDWEDFDSDVFTCRIEKNSSKRLFLRFISRDFLEEPEVSIKLTLNHTFGDSAVVGISKFIEAIDDIKWAKGSSGGSEVPTDPCPQHSEPIPSFGDIDGEIPKM
jgi:hypothetical protein